jgi:hypothetical protein
MTTAAQIVGFTLSAGAQQALAADARKPSRG